MTLHGQAIDLRHHDRGDRYRHNIRRRDTERKDGRMDFAGKVAVVTGAGKGLGRACAAVFAREGAAVAVVDLDLAAAAEVAAAIVARGGEALALAVDVASEEATCEMVERAARELGGIDVLVSNAGIQTYGSVVDTSLEVWQRTLAVNLTGVYLCARFCIPAMLARGGGAIVNVASVQGLATEPNLSAYAASKGGVIALTRTMALDYARRNIRVNCLCPGAMDTPMSLESFALAADPWEARRAGDAMQPLGRLGRADEVAEVALFLAGPRASFVTGNVYTADGGLLAGFQ